MPTAPEGPGPTPAVAALLALAAERATGVLEFPADPGGTVHLVEGRVSQVISPDVPGVAQRRAPVSPRAGLPERALLADATADAALDIFGGADAGRSITRFDPGRRAAEPLSPPLEAGELLAEIARRQKVLAAIAARARPDEPVTRAARLPVARVRLTARQWDLVRLADGRHTPRALARQLGSGVFATTVEVAALVQAGLIAPVTDATATPAPFLEAVSGA